MGDVAVASSRSDDPSEWRAALNQALCNAERHGLEAARWAATSRELAAELERCMDPCGPPVDPTGSPTGQKLS